jgi:hypothetical protein
MTPPIPNDPAPKASTRSARLARRARRTRGAVLAEYLVATAVVGLGLVYAFFGRGEQLLFDYVNARDLVLVPGQ